MYESASIKMNKVLKYNLLSLYNFLDPIKPLLFSYARKDEEKVEKLITDHQIFFEN
jgi:hypothetical protein